MNIQTKRSKQFLGIIVLLHFVQQSTTASKPEHMFTVLGNSHSHVKGDIEIVVTVTSFTNMNCKITSGGHTIGTKKTTAWRPTEIHRHHQKPSSGTKRLQLNIICDQVAFVLVDVKESNPLEFYSFMVLNQLSWEKEYEVCTFDKKGFLLFNRGFEQKDGTVNAEDYTIGSVSCKVRLDPASPTETLQQIKPVGLTIDTTELEWQANGECWFKFSSSSPFPMFLGEYGVQQGVAKSKKEFAHQMSGLYEGTEFLAFRPSTKSYQLFINCFKNVMYSITCYNAQTEFTMGTSVLCTAPRSLAKTNSSHEVCRIRSPSANLHVWVDLGLSSSSQVVITPIVAETHTRDRWIWSRNKDKPFGARHVLLLFVMQGEHANGILINGKNAGFSDNQKPTFYFLYQKPSSESLLFVEHKSGKRFAFYVMDMLNTFDYLLTLSPGLPLSSTIKYDASKHKEQNGTEGCPEECVKCSVKTASDSLRKCEKCTPGHKPPWCSRCFHGLFGEGCSRLCHDECPTEYCDYITGACDPNEWNVFRAALLSTTMIILFVVSSAVAYHYNFTRKWTQHKKEPHYLMTNEDKLEEECEGEFIPLEVVEQPIVNDQGEYEEDEEDNEDPTPMPEPEAETTQVEVHREQERPSLAKDPNPEEIQVPPTIP